MIALVFVMIVPAAALAENTVDVTPAQTVTVVGVFPSLKSVMEEVCRRGGVELRGFEAGDRPVTISYDQVPLATAIEGLLREESYLVGVTPSEAGKPPRITWIRVVGSNDGAPRQVTPGGAPPVSSRAPPALSFEVPATFGGAEFSSEDPEQRARALHAIASRLLSTEQVLNADPRALASTLQQYPHARELVTQLRDSQEDPEIRGKLEAILTSLP